MTGAEKIINAMKRVNKSGQGVQSELVSATVNTLNPLTFILENRIVLTNDFYELSTLEDWSTLQIGDKVRGFTFNNGQKFFINEKVTSASHDSIEKQLLDLRNDVEDLKRRVTALGG